MLKIRSMLVSVVLFVAAVWVGVTLLLYLAQDSLVFPAPPVQGVVLPEGAQRLSIETDDGTVLEAISVRAEKPVGLVLFFHGNGSSAAHEIGRALSLQRAGFSVLLAEYRGYGGSGGRPSAQSILADALVQYDRFAKGTDLPVFSYGHSLGAGVALYLATRRDIAAVGLEAPYDSLAEVAADAYPVLPVRTLFRHEIDAAGLASKIKVPVMAVHGTDDRVIPIGRGRALRDALGIEETWIELVDAGHNDLLSHGSMEWIGGFFVEVLVGLEGS